MENINELSVTIKLKPHEFQNLCRIIKKTDCAKEKNIDGIELDLHEYIFIASLCKRLTSSGKRKAEKLEALGTEIRNSMEAAEFE